MTKKQLRELRLQAAVVKVHGLIGWRQFSVASRRLTDALASSIAASGACDRAVCDALVELIKQWVPDPTDPIDGEISRVVIDNFCAAARELLSDPTPPAAEQSIDPRAQHEHEWIEAVTRESDDDFAQRIAHGFPDYYFSTHWRLVSEAFSVGRCAHCGRTDRDTSLHHLNDTSFGRERREDVIELCDPCHAREEGRGLWKYRRAA